MYNTGKTLVPKSYWICLREMGQKFQVFSCETRF